MTAEQFFAGLLAIFIFHTPLFAVPHINRNLYPDAKPCHVKRITPAEVRRFGTMRSAVISSASGSKRIAAIIVQFPSADANTSGAPAVNLSTFDGYFNDMKTFYTENSFGKLSLEFRFFGTGTALSTGTANATDLTGAYTMPQPLQYYGCGDVDPGCSGVSAAPAGLGGAYLIRDALQAARTATGGPTSVPGGTFDAVLVMHAGYGNETTSKNGDIWSAFYQEPTVIGAGGTTFVDGATFPELEASSITSPLGVMCHEFGHVLTLPDLYNTTVFGGASVVGDWDLMDAGPYLGNGTNPAHLGAWCKTYLTWAAPQTVTSRGSFSINSISNGSASNADDVLKLPVQNGGAQEYFLVEYRSKTAGTFDRQIPGTGILVWHIDDEITAARGFSATDLSLANKINTGSPHYGISIVTADGLTISNANHGTSGNAFGNGQIFSSPKSDNFSAQPSGISLVNISGSGGAAVSFDVANLAVSGTLAISKVINYPNPAGKGYAHPSGEGHTTLQFQLTRPANNYQINLYTLSGDLVRKVGKSEITLNIDRSADLKWVYEFDWDLKNGDGAHVAPGVYLYLIRADGQSKSTKAVIIR